jgi:ABC-2 type transport system ATP-binding protein
MSIIQTESLSKTYQNGKGQAVQAVQDVTLTVERGEIFGFLGPNGAGKSTTMRMLTTLTPPSGGQATIAGHDLLREAGRIRQKIGFVSQLGGAKGTATGREQLMLYGQLHGLTYRAAVQRTAELIEAFDLAHFIDRPVSTYSGGQKRRLELALGIIHQPELLFLDEPTTALDPQSRARLWDEIRTLRKNGTTVFVTTHYMDEADSLCDRIAVMDHGQVIALDTPEELKRRMSSDVISIELDVEMLNDAAERVSDLPFIREVRCDGNRLHLYVDAGDRVLPDVLRLVEQVHSVTLARPSLDDVFLHLTGRSLRETIA